MSLTIVTNHKPRPVLCMYDLPKKVQVEFDYLEDEQYSDYRFVKYKGWYYDIGDMMMAPESMRPDWDIAHNDTYFSGVLFKIVDDDVIAGRYYG